MGILSWVELIEYKDSFENKKESTKHPQKLKKKKKWETNEHSNYEKKGVCLGKEVDLSHTTLINIWCNWSTKKGKGLNTKKMALS